MSWHLWILSFLVVIIFMQVFSFISEQGKQKWSAAWLLFHCNNHGSQTHFLCRNLEHPRNPRRWKVIRNRKSFETKKCGRTNKVWCLEIDVVRFGINWRSDEKHEKLCPWWLHIRRYAFDINPFDIFLGLMSGFFFRSMNNECSR